MRKAIPVRLVRPSLGWMKACVWGAYIQGHRRPQYVALNSVHAQAGRRAAATRREAHCRCARRREGGAERYGGAGGRDAGRDSGEGTCLNEPASHGRGRGGGGGQGAGGALVGGRVELTCGGEGGSHRGTGQGDESCGLHGNYSWPRSRALVGTRQTRLNNQYCRFSECHQYQCQYTRQRQCLVSDLALRSGCGAKCFAPSLSPLRLGPLSVYLGHAAGIVRSLGIMLHGGWGMIFNHTRGGELVWRGRGGLAL